MAQPPYPRTKPTAIPWIGEVPEHWEVRKLKFGVAQTYGGGTPHTETPKYWKGDIHWVTAKDVKTDRLFQTEIQITEEGLKNSSASMVPAGTIVLVTRSGILKHTLPAAVCMQAMSINQDMRAIVPKSLLFSDYLLHYFKGLNNILLELTRKIGATVESIDMDVLFNMEWIFPPLDEQTHIARYLDHKTALIDAFLARKRRTIALLKEHRQALISQAVTKGLDPSVPMKDSGIEWIGEVPEHWEVKAVRFIGSCQNGVSKGADYFGSGYPFVSYGDVYKSEALPLTVEKLAQSSEADRELYSVRTGDVLFTRTSETIEEIGFASTCCRTIENATFSGFVIRMRPRAGILTPSFSKYYFRSDLHRAFFVKEMNLVTRASLSQDLLGRLPVLLPPLEEQDKIGAHLDEKMRLISDEITRVEASMERVREYRQALISAVVTGKVDVRGVEIADVPMGQLADEDLTEYVEPEGLSLAAEGEGEYDQNDEP